MPCDRVVRDRAKKMADKVPEKEKERFKVPIALNDLTRFKVSKEHYEKLGKPQLGDEIVVSISRPPKP